jgi:putative flippase GtrA
MTCQHIATMLRFLLVGVANTTLGLGLIYLSLQLGAGDIAANALGYGAGLLFSFFANRSWTFRHSGALSPAFWRFLTVFAVAYGANLASTLITLRWFGAGSFLAQVAGVGPYTVIFYLGSRRFAFNPETARQRP